MEEAYFDKETKVVVVNFQGVPSLDEFKVQAYKGLELLKESKSNKMLNDITKLEANSLENQDWVQNVWFPEVEKIGLRYFAFLVPENIFGQVSAEQTNEKAEEKGVIEIKYFEDKGEALRWLSEK